MTVIIKLYNKFLSCVPKNMRIPLIVALVWNCCVFYITRIFNHNLYHYDLTTKVDSYFPLLPWTVFIYFGSYIFWAVNYIIAARDSKNNWHFFTADFISKIICIAIFIILPTSVARPQLAQSAGCISNYLMRFLYWVDSPDNLFPSLHCLVSWFCVIAVRKNKAVPLWYKLFTVLFTLAVCICTLTTKQHVFVDTFTGVILAELCYQLTFIKKLPLLYKKIYLRLDKKHQTDL